MAPGRRGTLDSRRCPSGLTEESIESPTMVKPDGSRPRRGVEQLGGVDRLEVGDGLLERVAGPRLGQVVADDEPEVVRQAAGELLELEAEQPPVGAELHDVVGDLVLDPADHLEALEDVGDVAHGDEVLDLERRQRAGDLVEA